MGTEHSDRARYVTEQVALWLANDREHAEFASNMASDQDWVARYAVDVIRSARKGEAAWHVQQELSPADYDRIRWDDVIAELGEVIPDNRK